MDEKQKKTLLFVVLGVIIVIILMSKGCMNTGNTGNDNTGGNNPGGTTHAPCEDCQARWMNLHNWECSGLCSTGTCHVASGTPEAYLTNPFQRVDCSCGTPAVTDNCYTSGGYTAALTCGGTCADTSKSCQPTITGVCTCQPRPLMCSEITSIGSPSDCADATCPITGQACQFDTGRGICACMTSYPR